MYWPKKYVKLAIIIMITNIQKLPSFQYKQNAAHIPQHT